MSEETFRWVITGGVALSALCFLVIAAATVRIYSVTSKFRRKAEEIIDRITPVVDTVRQLTRDNGPKISEITTRVKEIAANATEISYVAKDQAHRFAEVGRDIADRTKAQVARVDAAVDDTVDQVQHAGSNLKAAAMKPVREATGVIAGVKAAVSTYASGRRPSIDHIAQDEEMFI